MTEPIHAPIPEWAAAVAREQYANLHQPVAEQAAQALAQRIADAWQRATQCVSCVYCGHEYPPGTPTSQAEALTAHIKVCTKHPMRAAEARIAELERFIRMLSTCPVIFPHMSGVPTSAERLGEMIDELLDTARAPSGYRPWSKAIQEYYEQLEAEVGRARVILGRVVKVEGDRLETQARAAEARITSLQGEVYHLLGGMTGFSRDQGAEMQASIRSLSHSLRSVIATLETIDADERQRAVDEQRIAHVHTDTIREAHAILDDHGMED